MMMKELLEQVSGCIDTGSPDSVNALSGAEYPAMFLYVGERAAGKLGTVRDMLKSRLTNGGSVLHAVMGAKCADADLQIDTDITDKRGEMLNFITGSSERLDRFNSEVRRASDRLMQLTGFPQMTRCFLFVITFSDEMLNALLPEFVMLLAENTHLRVYSTLFVNFTENVNGSVSSAAFFRELEDCQSPGFSCDSPIMMREGQRIPVHWEGAVFDQVFFLEMYRSDMKYSPGNAFNSARIAAVAAMLLDRAEPVRFPASPFFTAGIASVHKPTDIITHVMYKSVIDLLAGNTGSKPQEIPLSRLMGYDNISDICGRVMSKLPPVNTIISVLPADPDSDPDKVKNTNVRSILGYYGGADEEYFSVKFIDAGMRAVPGCVDIELCDIFAGYVNKGVLRLKDVLAYLAPDEGVYACLAEVTERIDAEEDELKDRLSAIMSQPCPGLTRGLFSAPTGCDILAAAVSARYEHELALLRLKLMRRAVEILRGQAGELAAAVSSSCEKIKVFSDELGGEILREIYGEESTLSDADAFTAHYARVVREAVGSLGEMSAPGGKPLWNILMNCADNGTDELAEAALGILHKASAYPAIREVVSQRFDEELYERCKDLDGGKDRNWVDVQLERRLTEASRADLRYSVFQPDNSLYCMGNREIGFVRKMFEYDDPGFSSVCPTDIACASYEQLAVYGVTSTDSVTYICECRKVYNGYVSEHGNDVYISRK